MIDRGFLGGVRNGLRPLAMKLRIRYLRSWGMTIGEGCQISFSAVLDKANPKGVHIGDDTAVNFGAVILTHDFPRRKYADTRIGSRCQIGARSIIMPGVTIGDECAVAVGSVVMKDVPPNTIVAGNPARPIERGMRLGPLGMQLRPDELANAVPIGTQEEAASSSAVGA